ncbi:unnamed protein product, partial [marine sediment metagenome]
AYAYDVRCSTEEITEDNWRAAPELPRFQVIRPGRPGSKEEMWIDILEPGTKYYFAIRVLDEVGNASPPAVAAATTAAVEELKLTDAGMSRVGRGSPAVGDGLTVWAFADTEKASPVTGGLLEDGTYARGNTDARCGNTVWDGARKAVRIAGCSNEFVAFQVAVELDDPAASREVPVSLAPFGPIREKDIRLYREWCVYTEEKETGKKTYWPDPLLPLEGKLVVPYEDNKIPGQKVGLVFVDIYVPHKTAPGAYTGKLSVGAITIPVELAVRDLDLPDTIEAIIFEMNNYYVWTHAYGKLDDDALAKLEHAYHRMAHEHRLSLNSVTHGHGGGIQGRSAPPLTGKGADTRVADWTAWDRRYGPLLDGSAFADLPRAGVPITHIYTPFNENWPAKINEHFNYNVAEDMLGTFEREYIDAAKAVCADFARHFNEKRWYDTQFQLFLNDKYLYRNPRKGRRGVS